MHAHKLDSSLNLGQMLKQVWHKILSFCSFTEIFMHCQSLKQSKDELSTLKQFEVLTVHIPLVCGKPAMP